MLIFFLNSLYIVPPNLPSNPAPESSGKQFPTWSNWFYEGFITDIIGKFLAFDFVKWFRIWRAIVRRFRRLSLSPTSTSRKPCGTHLFWDSEVVMPTMLNLFLFCFFFLFVFIFFVVLIHFFTKRPFVYIREISLAGTAVLFFILVVFCGSQYTAFFELSSFLSAGLDSWLEYRWSTQNNRNYLNLWSYSGDEAPGLGSVDFLWRFAVLDYIARMAPFFNLFNDVGPLSSKFSADLWQNITLNTYIHNGGHRVWTSHVPWWRGYFWPSCQYTMRHYVPKCTFFTAKAKFAWGFNGFFQDFGFLKYGVYKTSFFSPLLDSTFDIVFSFDGISLIFICLTTFIISLCIIVSWYSYKFELYTLLISLLLLTQLLIIISFSVLDLLFFYIAFESVLIPLFFLVGVFGSRERRIKAAYYLMFYTLFGSVPFLIGLIYIWHKTGQTNILILEALFYGVFSKNEIALLWFLFLPGFAFKIPLYPFHLWLPEAHVEAPTVGSVILAGLVLKLGGYGFIRFSLGLLYWGGVPFFGYVYWISAFSMLFAILCAACQIDLKRIIAYGSVSHMSLVTLCIFLGTQSGLESAMIMMLGHGFVSSGLFILIGSLYERYHTRNIRYYGGLYKLLPRFGTLFLLFILFDIGVPGSPAFVAEFVALVSITQESAVLAVLCSIPIIIGAGVSLLLASRVLFGFNEKRYLVSMPVQLTNFLYWCELQMPAVFKTFVQKDPNIVYVKNASIVVPKTFDLLPHEVFVLLCLFGGSFFLGVYPQLFLTIFTQDLELILQNVAFFF